MKYLNSFLLLLISVYMFPQEVMNISTKNLSFYFDNLRGAFYLENPYPKDNRYRYLLFKDIPPTSFITLYTDNSLYRLSERDLKVEEAFYLEDNKIKGKLSYKNINISLYFILTNFTKGGGDSLLNVIELENNSTNTRQIEIRFLFDTVSGEEKRNPKIFTSGGEKIEYDRIYEEGSIPDAFFAGDVEALELEFKDGLYLYPVLNNFYPARVIIANWKKLSQFRNVFIPETRSKFRYNPYSNPDVAILFIYRIKLNPKEKFHFGNVLSRSYIQKDRLKFNLYEQTFVERKEVFSPPDTNIALASEGIKVTNLPQEELQPKKETVPDTNELMLINAKLALYERLNALLDKIESKFLTTNQVSIKEKEEVRISPSKEVIVITNYLKDSKENEGKIDDELKKIQDYYEKRLKEVMDFYEKKLSEFERDIKKPET